MTETRGGNALERAEANFAAAKELCRTGHDECTYGGMAAANGYWLAAEDCPLGHGETCDLRAVCDGAPAETGFIGREGMMLVDDWIWRVCACLPCADLYAEAHPEWRLPDPDAPQPTYDEVMAKLHEQVEAERAAMSPAEREAQDMLTDLMLYGQHPAPRDPPHFTGLAGLFGLDDPIKLSPVAKPLRDRPISEPEPPSLGYILPPELAGDPLWDAMLHGPAKPAEPPGPASTATGLFDALGGVTPGGRADPTETAMNAIVAGELRGGRTIARAQWAPAGCTCPWPWPMSDSKHILTTCPHYTAPTRPVVGRNTRIGCQRYDSGTFVHGDPHDCPRWARG